MRYKNICQWIHTEAAKLPEEAYFARQYYDSPPKGESEEPHFIDEGGKGVFTIGQYMVNHARRLKRIWKRTKNFVEIDKYFQKFGLELNYKP